MKALLQRVTQGGVTIDGERVAQIGPGLVLLLGITVTDTERQCDFLAEKVAQLRIFEDEAGKLNRSVLDVGGEVLVVSQFTLCADCRKGRRPSFTGAARPEQAVPLYERFLSQMQQKGISTACGRFGADMQVHIENDGPVTLWLDTVEIMPKTS